MNKIHQIVEGAFAIGTIQNYDEIYRAVEFVSSKNISNFLEIGTNQGGTFYAWTCISNPGTRISIDIPHGEFGTNNFDESTRNKILSGYPGNCYFISGNSQDALNLAKVENYLQGQKLDFLFIDGDHTEDGVTRDFFLYKHLVKKYGWIGFHDIKDSNFHSANNCFVSKLWNKLEGDKVEFIDNSTEFGGIGFIQYNDNISYNDTI